jgi:hypothetical protein
VVRRRVARRASDVDSIGDGRPTRWLSRTINARNGTPQPRNSLVLQNRPFRRDASMRTTSSWRARLIGCSIARMGPSTTSSEKLPHKLPNLSHGGNERPHRHRVRRKPAFSATASFGICARSYNAPQPRGGAVLAHLSSWVHPDEER